MSVTVRDVMRLLHPVINRVMMMVARGVVKYAEDKGGLQVLQVELLNGELRGGIERPQTYGHSSKAPAGAEAFCVFVGGNRDHGLALSVTHRASRPRNVKDGESMLYDDQEQRVYLSRDGIDISAPSGKWLRLQVGNNFIQIDKDGIDLVAKRFRQMKAD